jgi:hypothetical protein
MRINLKEADEAVEGYGAPGLGLRFIYLLGNYSAPHSNLYFPSDTS